MHYLDGVPAEVAELIKPYLDPEPGVLSSLGTALSARRDAAMSARYSSGIETIWSEAEDAYVGIDDANRGEFEGGKWAKPQTMSGPVQAGSTAKGKPETKSTVFLRLTARYVEAGAAKLAEILLPPDEKAFSLTETPLPDLVKAKKDNSQVVSNDGQPLTRPLAAGEQPPPGTPISGAAATGTAVPAPQPAPAAAPGGAVQPGAAVPAPMTAPPPTTAPPNAPPRVPLTVADLAKENLRLANDKAKLAETRIYDWLTESRYRKHMRKVIFDAARLGSGVLKGPFPKVVDAVATSTAPDGTVDVKIKRSIQPGVAHVDVWNLFPDPSCGDDIHNGEHLFERDYMSDTQVLALKKLPGYITSQIDMVLAEEVGPSTTVSARRNTRGNNDDEIKGRRVVWYYYGVVTRDEIDCCRMMSGRKPLTSNDVSIDKKFIHVIVTMINDTVVRAVLNPLESGGFPYHVLPWQPRAGYWAGIGVGEQIKTPQRILNAAARSMLNNAGKSSGSQIVIDQGAIRPANGSWALEPDKIWYKTADSPGDDVRKAFYAFDVPNMTDEMLKLVEFAEKQGENATSIPLVTQGQSGKTTPDTFGGMQLQDNNANQLLRSIGFNTDDNVTEPLVTKCYEWLLLDPKVPNEEKGDFQIDAHGSSAMVERAIENQTLASLGPIVKDPAFGVSPRKWMGEYLRSRRIAPSRIQYSDEEQKRVDSQPPPEAPQVTAAKILASSRTQIAQGQQGIVQQSSAEDIQMRREELQAQREMQMLEYANKRGITLDQVKAELAKTAMTLQAQRELAAAEHGVALHMHHNKGAADEGDGAPPAHKASPISGPAKPLAQLPGRAANGEAFTQAAEPIEDEVVSS